MVGKFWDGVANISSRTCLIENSSLYSDSFLGAAGRQNCSFVGKRKLAK